MVEYSKKKMQKHRILKSRKAIIPGTIIRAKGRKNRYNSE